MEYATIVFPKIFDNGYTKCKKKIFRGLCNQMLVEALEMFEYKGLPETLDARELELEMIYTGMAIVSKVDGKLYALRGGYAGECDYKYLPRQVVVTNPYIKGNLGFSANLTINEDCVVIWNDEAIAGLFDLISLYACQLSEAEMTLRLQLINARVNKFLCATDDKVKEDALKVLTDIEEGKLGVIGDSVELEGLLKALNALDMSSSRTQSLKDTIEMIQYYKANYHIRLGLNDNYNMKREAINGTETSVNENTLFTLPLNMLKCREKGLEDLNKLYGTNASVEFKGVWKQAYESYKLSLKIEQEEVEAISDKDTIQGDPAESGLDEQPKEEPKEEEVKKDE